MKCRICGATCVCRHRGPGICCGCHTHKVQRTMTRAQVDAWRQQHELEPIDDAQWRKQFEQQKSKPTVAGELFLKGDTR